MYKQLTSEQRYTISVLLQKKCSFSFIAKTIGVSVSTVSREKRRNSNVQGVYDGRLAALKARRRKAGTPGNRSISPHVRSRVFELIRSKQWSPEQVSGWLMKQEGLSVPKSSIYNWIAAIFPYHKDNIRRHLRHGGRKAGSSAAGTRSPIPIMLMEKLDSGKRAVPLAYTVVRLLKGSGLPVRNITTDNGTEFAAYEIIARELDTTVYFAHPYCSWEKGAIENMNGLVRQYIPKRTDFRGARGYIRQIVEKLNNRPRKKNGCSKPADMMNNKIT